MKRHLLSFSVAALAFLILLAVYNTHIPVVALMDAVLKERDQYSVTVQVEGMKVRDCHLVKDSFVGWYQDSAGRWLEARGAVEFPGDTSLNSSRPDSWIDKQDFGLFKLNGVPEDASTIRVTVEHLCDGDEIPRITVNGPWFVGNLVK